MLCHSHDYVLTNFTQIWIKILSISASTFVKKMKKYTPPTNKILKLRLRKINKRSRYLNYATPLFIHFWMIQ